MHQFKDDLQGELETSDFKKTISDQAGKFIGSTLTGGSIVDVTKTVASDVTSFGIGIGLSLLGVFLAKKYRKSKAARAFAKMVATITTILLYLLHFFVIVKSKLTFGCDKKN